VISIEVLPDDVLLAIFDFYVDETTKGIWYLSLPKYLVEGWQPLVHVCRRWRTIVFGSPRRLNLRLGCSFNTPARDKLDIWPALPLCIFDYCREQRGGVDNIIAVLEHSDRVHQITLNGLSVLHLKKVLVAMQVPFPELTRLELYMLEQDLPESFLGGSAPRLQFLYLDRVPLLGLPKLLSSATHLATLFLGRIPHSGYISPEVMVTALSTLTRLRSLTLYFESSRSRPDLTTRRPPSSARSVLPVLTRFYFKGDGEYLDGIVSRIDIPQMDRLSINFFYRFEDTPRSIPSISHIPRFKTFQTARLFFARQDAAVKLYSQSGALTLGVDIPCDDLDGQLSSMGQIFASCLPSLSTLEDLHISEHEDLRLDWPFYIENTLWLELLRPFTSVKNLHLSGQVTPGMVPALQELVGNRTTEVLPTLQSITLLWPQPSDVREGIEQFVAARQAAGHPIAVSYEKSPWRPIGARLAHDSYVCLLSLFVLNSCARTRVTALLAKVQRD
jgi:F-box-like